jgi:hypothetical protein
VAFCWFRFSRNTLGLPWHIDCPRLHVEDGSLVVACPTTLVELRERAWAASQGSHVSVNDPASGPNLVLPQETNDAQPAGRMLLEIEHHPFARLAGRLAG